MKKGPSLPFSLCPEVCFVPLGLTKALIKADSQSTQAVAWDEAGNGPQTGEMQRERPAAAPSLWNTGLTVCGRPHAALGPLGDGGLATADDTGGTLSLLVTGRFLADVQSKLRGGR